MNATPRDNNQSGKSRFILQTLLSSIPAIVLIGVWTWVTEPSAADSSGSESKPAKTLTVERIDVIEPDGTLRMVISNQAMAPAPVIDGKTFERQGGDQAGIIFFNNDGDECGGLVYGNREIDGKPVAGGGMLFDRFRQDQVVGMSYREYDGQYAAGMNVWDRPERPLSTTIEEVEQLDGLPEAERQAAMQRMSDAGKFGYSRGFVGRADDGSSVVTLKDSKGRTRLTLSVTQDGAAEIAFLDEHGATIHRLVPDDANE